MFSEREEKIIKVVGNSKANLEDICEKVFEGLTKPFDDKITISNSIRRIMDKCEYNNLKWTLDKKRIDKKTVVFKTRRIIK